MSTKKDKQDELDFMKDTYNDAIVLHYSKEFRRIKKIFSKRGHSGCSGGMEAVVLGTALKHYLLNRAISPLTGKPEEWVNIGEETGEEAHFQNKRDSRVFMKNGTASFIEAIVWEGDVGGSFIGRVENISSSQEIKEFPFIPKTFYIGVIDYRWTDKEETTLDENGDWWTHSIMNVDKLDEVRKYYNIKELS